jgi:hypothetical protein
MHRGRSFLSRAVTSLTLSLSLSLSYVIICLVFLPLRFPDELRATFIPRGIKRALIKEKVHSSFGYYWEV